MAQVIIPDDVVIRGHLSTETMTIPPSTVTDASVATGAAIDPDKIVNRFRRSLTQAHGSAGTAERRAIHVALRDGTLNACTAALSVAPTSTGTHTIQIKKNGSNILSSAIVLDNANTAYTKEDAGSFTSSTYVAGDFFEVDVTVSGATLGQGLIVEVEFDEEPT